LHAIAAQQHLNAALGHTAALLGGGLSSRSGAGVPGRVTSRINVSNSGFAHVEKFHFNPAKALTKSQFTISKAALKALLQAKSTVRSPVTKIGEETFSRVVSTTEFIGTLAPKYGTGPTNICTVLTDKTGALRSAFPGTMP
jgi:hypothetical protein